MESLKVSLRHFLIWSERRSLRRAEAFTRPVLESYQRHLRRHRKDNGKPLGVSTQANRLSALKKLFAWLCREGRLPANPAADLEKPRAPRRLLHKALAPEEIEKLLAVPDVDDPLGLRDRALLELLYSSGLRRAEAARLALRDLDPARGTLFVDQGKGGKDRLVPLGARAARWLDRYRPPLPPPSSS